MNIKCLFGVHDLKYKGTIIFYWQRYYESAVCGIDWVRRYKCTRCVKMKEYTESTFAPKGRRDWLAKTEPKFESQYS